VPLKITGKSSVDVVRRKNIPSVKNQSSKTALERERGLRGRRKGGGSGGPHRRDILVIPAKKAGGKRLFSEKGWKGAEHPIPDRVEQRLGGH